MGVVSTLVANGDTPITLPYVPEFLLVDNVETDLIIDEVSANAQGINFQKITDQGAIRTISKWLMQALLGTDVKVAQIWKLANGQINLPEGQNFRLTLSNPTAGTPDVMAYSTQFGDAFVQVQENSINPRANNIISGVDALVFDATNFAKAEVIFRDGHVESELTLDEIASMMCQVQSTDASGLLGTDYLIDFNLQNVEAVKLFAGSGGALGFATVTL